MCAERGGNIEIRKSLRSIHHYRRGLGAHEQGHVAHGRSLGAHLGAPGPYSRHLGAHTTSAPGDPRPAGANGPGTGGSR